MMDDLKRYVLSLIGASLICGVIKYFSGRSGKFNGIINVACGLFLAITVFSPILAVKVPDLTSVISEPFYNIGEEISRDAAQSTKEEMETIIKDELRTYILEKASAHNMDINVEVNLDDEKLTPDEIVITGATSPYNKTVLTDYIQGTLGVPEEKLQWIK